MSFPDSQVATKVSLTLNDWIKLLLTHLISFVVLVVVIWTKLTVLTNEVHHNSQSIGELKEEIKSSNSHFGDKILNHLSDPSIHHSALTELRTRIDNIDRRLNQMENRKP